MAWKTVPLIYDCIGNHEEVLTAKLYEKWGLLDLQGNYVEDNTIYKSLSSKYDQVFINNGEVRTYSFVLEGKYGLADADGNEVIYPHYDWLGNDFVEDMLAVGIRGEGVGFVNKLGEEVVRPQYEEASDFLEGWSAVRLNGKWGAITKLGEIVVPLIHDKIIGMHAEKIWVAE